MAPTSDTPAMFRRLFADMRNVGVPSVVECVFSHNGGNFTSSTFEFCASIAASARSLLPLVRRRSTTSWSEDWPCSKAARAALVSRLRGCSPTRTFWRALNFGRRHGFGRVNPPTGPRLRQIPATRRCTEMLLGSLPRLVLRPLLKPGILPRPLGQQERDGGGTMFYLSWGRNSTSDWLKIVL